MTKSCTANHQPVRWGLSIEALLWAPSRRLRAKGWSPRAARAIADTGKERQWVT